MRTASSSVSQRSTLIASLLFVIVSLSAPAVPSLLAYDSEWPPVIDPNAQNPDPAPGLQMGRIAILIPAEFSAWFSHQHLQGWGEFPLGIALGDLEGADDQQDLDIVMLMRDEILLAASLDIDFVGRTGNLTPRWCWKLPDAPADPPGGGHEGRFATNPLIWDFDRDGQCEVAVVAPKEYELWGQWYWGRAIYVLEEDPDPGPGPWEFSVPPPLIVASSPANAYDQVEPVGDRIGVCKVQDGANARDIVSHSHDGVSISIWSLAPDGQGGLTLDRLFANLWSPPKTHEYNYTDVDGDGYDEFIWDGILDFVDAGPGGATPTNTANPEEGVWRWRTGIGENWNHHDQMLCLDFDPSHPGLEIISLPEEPWTDNQGIPRLGVDTLWDTDGNILRENADCPYHHPQTAYCGNWTDSRDGFEFIFVPKSFGNPTVGGGETWLAGSYAVDIEQNELAVDGAYWKVANLGYAGNHPKRASGPCLGMEQLDWDGDRSQDEILNDCWECFYVWRMGEKGDWGSPPPAGMPSQAEVQNPWVEEGYTVWWDFYQGYNGGKVATNGWNHGGAGLYTHYYEKLGEAYPGHGLYVLKGFDMGHDYREEAVAVTPVAVNVYFNEGPIPYGHSAEPLRLDPVYRRFRMEGFNAPYLYPPSDLSGAADGTGGPASPLVLLVESFPNPFNPSTTLSFELERPTVVSLVVYDIAGRRVVELIREFREAGRHEVIWRGRDDRSREMPSGAYFARLAAAGRVATRKLVLVR